MATNKLQVSGVFCKEGLAGLVSGLPEGAMFEVCIEQRGGVKSGNSDPGTHRKRRKRRKYLDEATRAQIANLLIEGKMPQQAIAKRYGINPGTVSKLKKKYVQNGVK